MSKAKLDGSLDMKVQRSLEMNWKEYQRQVDGLLSLVQEQVELFCEQENVMFSVGSNFGSWYGFDRIEAGSFMMVHPPDSLKNSLRYLVPGMGVDICVGHLLKSYKLKGVK